MHITLSTAASFASTLLNLLTSSRQPYAPKPTPTQVAKSAVGDWAEAYVKAEEFVSALTDEQKLSLITGEDIDAVSWTAYNFKDGTQGVQNYFYVSGFSESQALAMTWDPDLVYTNVKAVGSEFYLNGFQVINGPTSQVLGRTPWSGRLVETFTPDPYLNGITFGKAVKGFLDAGVIPGGKHFLLNEQETNRTTELSDTTTEFYSSNVDDKTLHELYLWSFYDGVKAGLPAVMCALTKVNDTFSCENSQLLNTILKHQLGFPGFVFTDYDAQHSGTKAAENGLDYGSTDYWNESSIIDSISSTRLTDMAIRNVIAYYYVGLDNGKQGSLLGETDYKDVRSNHSSIIREVGAASMVLLKNKNNALPLDAPLRLAIFGSHAGPATAGPNQAFTILGSGPTYEGHLASGSGSAQSSMPYLVTPQQALTERAAEDGTMISWVLNNTYTEETITYVTSLMESGTGLNPSIETYAGQDQSACLVFLNALAGEGVDRTELYNEEQDELVNTVADNCNNTIVILNTVGARIMESWIDHDNVTAVLYGSLLGQESGHSIADVLYGDVNPSGHLTYTIAKSEDDYPVKICYTAECNFTEANYIDYRWFDEQDIEPRYEFGYGLSYTTFDYTAFSAKITNSTALKYEYPTENITVGGRPDLWYNVIQVSLTLENNGTVAGNAVPQLYISYPDSASQPPLQLRGFEKVYLASGASTTVTFNIRRRDISMWNVTTQEWRIEPGQYTFYAGASSRDLRLWGSMTLGTSS